MLDHDQAELRREELPQLGAVLLGVEHQILIERVELADAAELSTCRPQTRKRDAIPVVLVGPQEQHVLGLALEHARQRAVR